MKKTTIIKVTIVLGVIILVVIMLHLVGQSMLPMIKNHMGL